MRRRRRGFDLADISLVRGKTGWIVIDPLTTAEPVAEAWLLTGGFAYGTSAVSDSRRAIPFPVDRQFRYALGVQWRVSKDVMLGGRHADRCRVRPIHQSRGPLAGTLVGDYSPNLLHAVGFNLAWRF